MALYSRQNSTFACEVKFTFYLLCLQFDFGVSRCDIGAHNETLEFDSTTLEFHNSTLKFHNPTLQFHNATMFLPGTISFYMFSIQRLSFDMFV